MKWQKPPKELDIFLKKSLNRIECIERKMFGCPAYFINGNMFIGAFQKNIIIRMPPQDIQNILEKYDGIKPFEPRPGVRMKQYLSIPEIVYTNKQLFSGLLRKSIRYVRTLPPKTERKKRRYKTRQ